MKKKLLSLILLISSALSFNAQVQYGVYQIPFSPVEINSPTLISLSDDSYSNAISLDFPFVFFGQAYQNLVISSNGYVRFDITQANGYSDFTVNESLPNSQCPMNSIFLSWFDLNPQGNPLISYQTIGEAPNRVFVVKYESVPYFSCNDILYTGQLKLYEGTNNIDMHITSKQLCNGGWSDYAIQGIQNSAGTEAFHVPGRNNNGIWQASNEAWRFDPDTVSAPACYMNGRVIADFNGNCVMDGLDYALPNQVVIRDVDQVYVSTNQAGEYSFEADTGNYQIAFN
jgi:hypothetical protein